jgi:hypothetical protein
VVKDTKERIPLSPDLLAAHLSGWITVGLYAINPDNQACKWIAIDADYTAALADLDRLQAAFAVDGVEALLETSRLERGHLWIFNDEPLPASLLRRYIYNKAKSLGLPIKVKGTDDGLEIFPKQDSLGKDEFGNAIRAPFGIHRATGMRYWFKGAEPTLSAQLALLRNATRLNREQLDRLTNGLPPIEAPRPIYSAVSYSENNLAIVPLGRHRRSGKNYIAACPVCDGGNAPRDFHLSVKISDPTIYHCWHECRSEDIKRALGVDLRKRLQFAA